MPLGARRTFHGFSRHTFARNDLLFTMSDNTRMQTAPVEATHCMRELVFTDEHSWKA